VSELDAEVVELLKRSVKQQGQLLPVIKDQYGNILSGRHRKAADPNWRETTVVVADELDRELKIVHFNVQRRPSKEETAARLLRIAELLEERGVPSENVCSEMAKLVPYSERYIQQLLPEKYKREYKKRTISQLNLKSEDKELVPLSSKTSDTSVVVERGSPPKPQTAEQPVECQSCHVNTWFPYYLKDGRVLCSLCFERLWKQGMVSADDLLGEQPVQTEKPKAPKPEIEEALSGESESVSLPKIPVDVNAGEVVCSECGRKFCLLHVHHPDGRISHRLEEVKGE